MYKGTKKGNEKITIKDYLFTIQDLLEQVVHYLLAQYDSSVEMSIKVNAVSNGIDDIADGLIEFRKELNSLERL